MIWDYRIQFSVCIRVFRNLWQFGTQHRIKDPEMLHLMLRWFHQITIYSGGWGTITTNFQVDPRWCLIPQKGDSHGDLEPGPFFESGIAALMNRWTALRLAVDNGWGGRDGEEKYLNLQDEILEWFYKGKGEWLVRMGSFPTFWIPARSLLCMIHIRHFKRNCQRSAKYVYVNNYMYKYVYLCINMSTDLARAPPVSAQRSRVRRFTCMETCSFNCLQVRVWYPGPLRRQMATTKIDWPTTNDVRGIPRPFCVTCLLALQHRQSSMDC